jgi:hypothetical protein
MFHLNQQRWFSMFCTPKSTKRYIYIYTHTHVHVYDCDNRSGLDFCTHNCKELWQYCSVIKKITLTVTHTKPSPFPIAAAWISSWKVFQIWGHFIYLEIISLCLTDSLCLLIDFLILDSFKLEETWWVTIFRRINVIYFSVCYLGVSALCWSIISSAYSVSGLTDSNLIWQTPGSSHDPETDNSDVGFLPSLAFRGWYEDIFSSGKEQNFCILSNLLFNNWYYYCDT